MANLKPIIYISNINFFTDFIIVLSKKKIPLFNFSNLKTKFEKEFIIFNIIFLFSHSYINYKALLYKLKHSIFIDLKIFFQIF